jgi:hypothetical protein
MSNSVRAYPEPLRTIAANAIGVGFTPLGTPFAHPIRLFKIVNTTNQIILISWDGLVSHDIVPSNGFVLYDISSNKTSNSNDWNFAQGTQIHVTYSGVVAPTVGAVDLVAFYGQN